MNIASVPWRCGQSWTVPGTGPSEPGTPANCSARLRELGVGAGAVHRGDHARGLGDHRRAGRVEHHAAGADQVERGPHQLALQHHQRDHVVGLAPPARLGPATQRAQPGAGRVDQDPVEDAGAVRRQGAVGGHHARRTRYQLAVGGQGPADQPGAGRQPLAGDQPGPALGRERRQQPGLAAGTRAEVEPELVAALERRLGQRQGDQLRALVLHRGPALGHRGHRARVAALQHHAVRRVGGRLAGQLVAGGPARAGRPG